jgi:RIO kinase 2
LSGEKLSSTERAARVIKGLKDEEWRTLAGLERTSMGHGTADLGKLARVSHIPPERARFAIDSLVRRDLATRKGGGFALTKEGVEVMALKDYVRKDLIFALGAIIAKGKESDVYETLTEEGTARAIKFYKIGRTSFTSVRKKRARGSSEIRSWMNANYEAASREYRALRKLDGLSPAFPRAIAYSRSTVLMAQVSGIRLSQRPFLGDPAKFEQRVFEAVREAYTKARLVNADLSEYNILTDGDSFWLIDWPQAVETSHPNSDELLRHDVEAVTKFFRKAYGVPGDPEKMFGYVTGNTPDLGVH